MRPGGMEKFPDMPMALADIWYVEKGWFLPRFLAHPLFRDSHAPSKSPIKIDAPDRIQMK